MKSIDETLFRRYPALVEEMRANGDLTLAALNLRFGQEEALQAMRFHLGEFVQLPAEIFGAEQVAWMLGERYLLVAPALELRLLILAEQSHRTRLQHHRSHARHWKPTRRPVAEWSDAMLEDRLAEVTAFLKVTWTRPMLSRIPPSIANLKN